MASNELLLKADLTVADLQANGGELVDEQANRFVRKLIKEPTILRDVRTIEMRAPQRQSNKIQFGSRIMRAATADGSGLSAGDRAPPVADPAPPTPLAVMAAVPPLVNTTSEGWQPSMAATCSLAWSTAFLAVKPKEWLLDGLPKCS